MKGGENEYWSFYIFMRCRRPSIRAMFEGDGKKCTADIVFIKDEGYKRLILIEPSSIVRTKASIYENGLEIETNEG